MFRLNKKLVFSMVALLFVVAIFYNFSQITGSFYANVDWEREWENRLVIELDQEEEYYEDTIEFGVYKPTQCSEGVFVTDGIREIQFTLFDEEYEGGVCVRTGIRIKNPTYTDRRVSISPIVDEEPVRRIGITGRVTLSRLTVYIYYGKITVLPEYNKLENDPDFDVVIESTILENSTLKVIFHHTSEVQRNITVFGDVNYTLSTSSVEGYQNVTLNVYNWAEQYFQLIVE